MHYICHGHYNSLLHRDKTTHAKESVVIVISTQQYKLVLLGTYLVYVRDITVSLQTVRELY